MRRQYHLCKASFALNEMLVSFCLFNTADPADAVGLLVIAYCPGTGKCEEV